MFLTTWKSAPLVPMPSKRELFRLPQEPSLRSSSSPLAPCAFPHLLAGPPGLTASSLLPKPCLWPLCLTLPPLSSSVTHYKKEIFLNMPKMYSSPKALCSTKGWFFGLCTGPGSPWPQSPGLGHRLEVLTGGEEGGDQQLRTSPGFG